MTWLGYHSHVGRGPQISACYGMPAVALAKVGNSPRLVLIVLIVLLVLLHVCFLSGIGVGASLPPPSAVHFAETVL